MIRPSQCIPYAPHMLPAGVRGKIVIDEALIRQEAKKYPHRTAFASHDTECYKAALRLGIMEDLGFPPPRYGFNAAAPAYFYFAVVKLTPVGVGAMFGISGRHPWGRWRPAQMELMSDRSVYYFQDGGFAKRVEKKLKQSFIQFAVKRGQSPKILDKPGTGGEILVGVSLATLIVTLKELCPDLPAPTIW